MFLETQPRPLLLIVDAHLDIARIGEYPVAPAALSPLSSRALERGAAGTNA